MHSLIEHLTVYFNFSLKNGIGNFTIFEIIITLFLIIFTISIRSFFAKFLIKRLDYLVKKISNNTNNLVFDNLEGPIKIIPYIFILIYLNLFLDLKSGYLFYINKLNQTLLSVFIFWTLYALFTIYSKSFDKLEKIFSRGLVNWVISGSKFLIIFLGIVAVLELWGIRIGPVIAGLGLFGVAVALGAQDLFKNLISGILIIFEKKFQIYDVVNIEKYGDGVIEKIGFRSTTIRKFDSTPIIIPNYILAENAVSNYSNRKYRRINWIIGLEYSSTIDKLKNIIKEIDEYIKNDSEMFIVNNDYNCYVRLEKFNDSSIDILISCFTNTTEWNDYLKIRESLAFSIKSIIEKNNLNFAFPSHSIYIEKNDS